MDGSALHVVGNPTFSAHFFTATSTTNAVGRSRCAITAAAPGAKRRTTMPAAIGASVIGPAATVDDALRLVAATDRLDAAVLDVNLRGAMVYPVADALTARGVPFVFATGYDSTVIPPRFSGVKRCAKPVQFARMMRTLFPPG